MGTEGHGVARRRQRSGEPRTWLLRGIVVVVPVDLANEWANRLGPGREPAAAPPRGTLTLDPGPLWAQLLLVGATGIIAVVIAMLALAVWLRERGTTTASQAPQSRPAPSRPAPSRQATQVRPPQPLASTPRPVARPAPQSTARQRIPPPPAAARQPAVRQVPAQPVPARRHHPRHGPAGRRRGGEQTTVTDLLRRVRQERQALQEHQGRRARPRWWEVMTADTDEIPVWRGIKSDVDEYPTVPTIRHYRWFGRFRGQLSTEDAPGQDSLPTTPILPGIGTVHIRISSRPSP